MKKSLKTFRVQPTAYAAMVSAFQAEPGSLCMSQFIRSTLTDFAGNPKGPFATRKVKADLHAFSVRMDDTLKEAIADAAQRSGVSANILVETSFAALVVKAREAIEAKEAVAA